MDIAAECCEMNTDLIACSNGLHCLEAGRSAIRMIRKFGADLFICASAEPWRCHHAIHYGYSYFCLCPALIRIAGDSKNSGATAPGPLTAPEALQTIGA